MSFAEELNARGLLARRSGRWHASTGTNLLGLQEANSEVATWSGHPA